MNKESLARIKKDGIWSVIIAFIKWVGELFFGDFVINSLKGIMFGNYLTSLIEWSKNNQFFSTFLFLLFVFLIFVSFDFIFPLFKKKGLFLIPRNGKIHEGLWEGHYTWLEVVGVLNTGKYVAILKKLESEKDGAVTNYLIQITKSSAPRLDIVDEKLFVTKPDGVNTLIALKNGTSKPFPEGVGKFYFEVELLESETLVKDFKGYLIDGYPSWRIEAS